MTIGKIYCAKLIYENYKHMKKKRLEKKKKVRTMEHLFFVEITRTISDRYNIRGRSVWGFTMASRRQAIVNAYRLTKLTFPDCPKERII